MDELIDLLLDWADDAYNWLHNFFRELWGIIREWWSAIKGWIDEQLGYNDEVVIVAPTTPVGQELYEAIIRSQGKAFEGTKGLETLYGATVKNDAVNQVYEHKASVQERGVIDRALADNDGILRIK